MNTGYLPIANYLPHSGAMVLLDRVIDANADHLSAELTIRADSPFCDGERVGAWIGIEYMAQTIAALAGWEARARGEPVKVGLLVGTRQYKTAVAAFELGQTLHVSARREYQADNGVAVMDCTIATAGGTPLASASISVYQPDNLQEYLKQA